MAGSGPTISRLPLGQELQQPRDRAGKEPEEEAARPGWDPGKVSKVEQGTATVSATEIDALVSFLDADPATADRIRRLGTEARKRGSYGKVSDWARTYVGMEAGASEIDIFAEELIPGLLQTEDYAREVAKESLVTKAADVDQLVSRASSGATSCTRQSAIVHRLGEAALRRLVGEPAVVRSNYYARSPPPQRHAASSAVQQRRARVARHLVHDLDAAHSAATHGLHRGHHKR